MKTRRLRFRVKDDPKYGQPLIIPYDEESGEEIDLVFSCSVFSKTDDVTRMVLEVIVCDSAPKKGVNKECARGT